MKVKQLLIKLRNNSNCDVFVQSNNSSSLIQLKKDEIKNLNGISIEMTINSFEIIDNVLTIFVN